MIYVYGTYGCLMRSDRKEEKVYFIGDFKSRQDAVDEYIKKYRPSWNGIFPMMTSKEQDFGLNFILFSALGVIIAAILVEVIFL